MQILGSTQSSAKRPREVLDIPKDKRTICIDTAVFYIVRLQYLPVLTATASGHRLFTYAASLEVHNAQEQALSAVVMSRFRFNFSTGDGRSAHG